MNRRIPDPTIPATSTTSDVRDLLTPQMRLVLAQMAQAGHPPLYTLTAKEARAAYEAGTHVLEPKAPELARVEDFTIPARDGYAIPARLYAPSLEVLPVLLYFHGGGFVIGSVASHDEMCRALSAQSGCAVVSVDYRMAPAHRFPVAVNDAFDAVVHISSGAMQSKVDGSKLAVGGDSAGGTLSAVCALHARDQNIPLALQLLFYPACGAQPNTPSHSRFAHGLVLEKSHIDWFFGQYIDQEEREDWRFAPLNAPDVEGVAPAWFGLAECDPLVDEGILYADKLRHAGVAVDLTIYRGVTHEFIKMGRAIPEALAARSDAARALRNAFELNP